MWSQGAVNSLQTSPESTACVLPHRAKNDAPAAPPQLMARAKTSQMPRSPSSTALRALPGRGRLTGERPNWLPCILLSLVAPALEPGKSRWPEVRPGRSVPEVRPGRPRETNGFSARRAREVSKGGGGNEGVAAGGHEGAGRSAGLAAGHPSRGGLRWIRVRAAGPSCARVHSRSAPGRHVDDHVLACGQRRDHDRVSAGGGVVPRRQVRTLDGDGGDLAGGIAAAQ